MNVQYEKLQNVAPAKPLKRIDAPPDEMVWHLNLDRIESNSGKIIEEIIAPVADANNSTHWFDECHVLYSKLRPYLNKVVVPNKPGIATTELVPLMPDPKRLDRVYLSYYLKSPHFVHWVCGQVAGAKMPRVSMKVFWNHEIPLPPLPEQKRIAAILNKADAIRRKRQQAIKLADDLLRATFLDMFGDPVTNPKGWKWGTIRELVSEVKYGTSQKADVSEGEYPMLRMMNITYEGRLDITNLKYVDLKEIDKPKYLAENGDLLFNRTNSKELVGKTTVFNLDIPMAIAGYLIRVRTNKKASPYYISGYLNSKHGKQTLISMCKSIVGMANINAQELQDIKILLPPMKLQKKYTKMVYAIENKKVNLTTAINYGEDLFNSLTQRAFRGEL